MDIRRTLTALSPLAESAWRQIAALLRTCQIPKAAHLLRAGDHARHVYFIRQGLLREYYTTADGDEATRRFCAEGELSGSLADLLSGAPALCSIEALEPTRLWQLDWLAIDRIAETEPSLMRLLRRIAETLYQRKMEREYEMLTLSARDRYRRFALQQPGLLPRLPRLAIAGYLGITPVHLSRIAKSETSKPAAAARRKKT